MAKKLVLLAMAVAAVVAFAAPAMASAHTLSDPSGMVPVGETVTAFSGNTVTFLGSNPGETLECAEVEVHGIVEQNNGTVVIAMDEEGADTATGCTLFGGPTTVAPTLENIVLGSTGTGTFAEFSFLVAGVCPETSAAMITYNSPTSIHIAGTVAGPPGCVNGAPITGDFEAEDKEGAIEFS